MAAESLRQMLESMDTEEPACDFLCDHSPEGPDDLCCAKCRTVTGEQVPSCARVTAMPSTVGMEKWLGDTGTDQDMLPHRVGRVTALALALPPPIVNQQIILRQMKVGGKAVPFRRRVWTLQLTSPPAMITAPAMPVEHNVYEPHRSDMRQLVEEKIQELTEETNASLLAAVVQLLMKPKYQTCFSAVAKVLNKKELAASKDAQASLDKEWDKLLNKKTWDQERVKECRRVVEEARNKCEKVHIGRIFDICTLKGSELPVGNPQRKYKGRSCFQ